MTRGKGVSAGLLLLPVLLVLSWSSAASAATCPNEGLRTGPSAGLVDCRAYELVTPPDTNGRMLEAPSIFAIGRPFDLFPTELASPSLDSFAYMTYAGGLTDPSGAAGTFDVYAADRTATGWVTDHQFTPPTLGLLWSDPGGISQDHSYAFATNERQASNFLISSSGERELTGVGSLGIEPAVQGRYISNHGSHVLFTSGKDVRQSVWCVRSPTCATQKLEPDAPPTGTGAIYDREAGGITHVVSKLPGDEPLPEGTKAFYEGTSKDASSVVFRIGDTLYVRINNGATLAEETLKVSEGTSVYGGLSDDGRYLFYVEGGESGTIHRVDTETDDDIEVNPVGIGSIVNVSSDGSHVYFISAEQLDAPKGTAGQPNLYLWTGGAPKFITTVAASDLVQTSGSLVGIPSLSNWTRLVVSPMVEADGYEKGPGADSSRATPDGGTLVFESKAKLGGYENAGHTEIYRFDSVGDALQCLSCNPAAAQATADARLQDLNLVHAPFVIHNLSDDGQRVFFETTEALTKADTDGINDVYEWQESEGTSSIDLISSGKSPEYPVPGTASPFAPAENRLLGITPSGEDVFFTAKEPLVAGAGENGAQAIYDARVNGGFSVAVPSVPCSEEGCRPAPTPPRAGSSSLKSEEIAGNGNVKPRKHRCTRKTRRGKSKKHRGCSRHKAKSAQRSAVPTSPASDEARGEAQVSSSTAKLQATAPSGSAPQSKKAPGTKAVSTTECGSEGTDFDIESVGAELSTVSAGAHPDFLTSFEFTHFNEGGKASKETACAGPETISIDLPPGLIGLTAATPSCSTGDLMSFGNCPAESQIGIARIKVGVPLYSAATEPVFNVTPPHPESEVARLGFIADFYPVFIDVKVHTASDYGVTATVHSAPGLGVLVRARTRLWADPSNPEHDTERLTPSEAPACNGTACVYEEEHEGKAPEVARTGVAFMTNPSACQEGSVGFRVTTYQLPGQVFEKSAPLAPITDCTDLPFAPSFEAEPTSHVAGAPTGLQTKLTVPQHLGAEERATSTMREARVTLPAGMQVAAGAANWIGVCSEEQVGYHEEVDTDCPDNSKLGTATILSPALSVPIEGTIYQRSPRPGHQLGLWLTSDALGLHIKIPGELEPDPTTGRLSAVFRDLPQVPVEEIDLNVWGGPRAPLQNPDHCGTFTTDFSFSPHSSDPAATGQSQMQITEGCNQGFSPTLKAGVTEPTAGKYSPFVFDLNREDGQQALRGFELKLPDGELAKIKGVPLCSDADAAASACPAGSRIGSLQATTGPGPEPFTLPEPGKAQPQIYLSGPYQGAPFSIVSEVPAQAGPFDLGVLAVRSGLNIEPETGRAVVKADPLPQFFEGVGIAYRHLHAVTDRPDFMINPTDCRELAVTADVTSTQGTVAHPQARFQVDGCKALKFKPKLALKLKGGTKRAQYPALTAVLEARKGDANIAFTSVALPHSEFLAQEHIGTICTRKQFAADACPKGSVYGKAKAMTPLLDKPLSGPVYLRSSDHPLPDLVAKLGGQLEIDLVGRIDSIHGGIRATFESVPDAPVSKFVLQMKGGAKSLLTNSTDICRGSHRAAVRMKAQNGRAVSLRPVLQSNGCGKKKLGKHHKHH
jgi:hypothetical protein